MKTLARPRRTVFRLHSVLIGLILLATVSAVASHAVDSQSRIGSDRTSNLDEMKTNSSMTPMSRRFSGWAWTPSFAPVAGETVEVFAADCTTPQTEFVLGETVCAKTNGIDLTVPNNHYMNWTDSQLNQTNGGTITQNPQYFLFVPPTMDTWKATVGRVTPADSSIIGNPPLFTVGEGAAMSTFTGDCLTPKTVFVLGETVCARATGLVGFRFAWQDAAGYIEKRTDITTDPQTDTFELPSDQESQVGDVTVDNRGQWRANAVTSRNSVRRSAFFTVKDPDNPVVDLSITKSRLGDNPQQGGQVQYLVRLINNGPDAAANVHFVDDTFTGLTFNSVTETSGLGFICTGSGSADCTIATLPAGKQASFLLNFTAGSAGSSAQNTAEVSSDTTEQNTLDNTFTTAAVVIGSSTLPPSCTLSCPGNITVTASAGQNGATVTFASPTTSGTCSSVSIVPASGSFFAIGTSVVTASTDEGDTCSFTVTVNAAEDNEAPVISCPADITVDESSSAADSANITYNVTATDNSGSATISCNPPSGSSFPIGTHQVTCTAEDTAGNTDTCTFNVTVNQLNCDLDANSPPPTPNVASLPTITRTCSATLLAADNPRATDACGGTINGDITHVDGQPSNDRTFDAPGTYVVTWSYTDSAGNTTTQNQSIEILPDNSVPVANVATLPTVTGECSVTLTPPTATDNCAGEIQGTTVVPSPITTVGTHTVVWTYDDGRGNTSEQNQTVVVTDTTAPVLTLTGPSSVTVECHASYTDAGATATDNCSPAPTPTSTSNVDLNTPGTYQVVWTATDAGGNTDSETRTVVVVDTTAPVITLNGASTITLECPAAFTDPGASAADSCDTTVPVNVAGSVNAAVGTYTLTYTASDDSGNAATSVSRTVTVVDTTAPAVTLNGAAEMTVILGASFTDLGATANDNCTGSLAVAVSGSVNTNAIGTYTLTYSATDASNNTGTATRTVKVVYDFAGFFSPVSNSPTLNSVNAGRAIPVKFSLAGDQGLNIFAANNPYSVSLNCSTSDPGVDVTETLTAGGSSLSYSGGQYIYVWKTESSWTGCRQLVITLNDGTVHTANFKFK